MFVDSKNNEPVMQIINKLAAEMPDIVFMRLDVRLPLCSPPKNSSGRQSMPLGYRATKASLE